MSLNQTGVLPVFTEGFVAASLSYGLLIEHVAEAIGSTWLDDDKNLYGESGFGYQMGFACPGPQREITVTFFRRTLDASAVPEFCEDTLPNEGNDLVVVAFSFTEEFMQAVIQEWKGNVKFVTMRRSAPWFRLVGGGSG